MCARRRKNDYEQLKSYWYERLKNSGFVDIEDDKQNLKSPNKRTIAYKNQEIIREFFLRLDQYINEECLSERHKIILEMYSSGVHIKKISESLNLSRQFIHKIISFHKKIIKDKYIN